MKPWRGDEEALACLLGGRRRSVRRAADVVAGAYRLDVRRRCKFRPLWWLVGLEDSGGGHVAVVVHCVEAGRWVVLVSLDEFRFLARMAGLLD